MIKLFNSIAGFNAGFEVDGSVRLPSGGLVVRARNVSLFGVQTISALPFGRGTRQGLEFRLRQTGTLVLRARAIYCFPLGDADGPSFGTGWAWIRDRTTTKNAAALVNYLTDACAAAEFGATSLTTWSPTD